jgi:photosystem II stability/assembly factor-like uncharacterized protein
MQHKFISTVSLLILLGNQAFGQWTKLPHLAENVISVYIADSNLLAGTEAGIYYSKDEGDTWDTATGINTIATSFAQEGKKLLVSSYEQVFHSMDYGTSWTALPTIYTFQNVNKIVVSDRRYVVGMDGSGVWFSEDGGTAWRSSNSSWQSRNTDIVHKGNMLVASYIGSGYLQISSTGGQTWYAPGGNGLKIGSSSAFQDVYCLAVKDDSVLIAGTQNDGVYTSNDGVYFSYDDGNNWSKEVNGLTTTAVNSIVVVRDLIFLGTKGGGVFYSADEGKNWTSLNIGLSNLTINKLYSEGTTLYAGVPTGIFKVDVCGILKRDLTLNAVGSTAITAGDSVMLVAQSNVANVDWYLNDVVIPKHKGNIYFAKDSGNYKAVIAYSPSCRDTSNVVSVVVTSLAGVKEAIYPKGLLKIYPNPSIGTVCFDAAAMEHTEQSEVFIYDVSGRLMKTFPLKQNSLLTTNGWNNGVYLAVVRNSNKISQPQKFIVAE